jgi:hypothetical protein
LPLEDEVQVWLDKGAPYCLQIVGGPGSGKSTALAHLADEFHGLARITFLDTDDWLLPPSTGTLSRFVIFAGNETPADHARQLIIKLAPWGRDELIEYLLATHPKECASVVSRLTRAEEQQFRGVPELWRVALDELAGNASLGGPIEAVIGYIQRNVSSPEVCWQLESNCLEGELRSSVRAPHDAQPQGSFFAFVGHPGALPRDVLRLLRHAVVRRNLAALALVAQLETGDWKCDFLTARLSRDLSPRRGHGSRNVRRRSPS